VCRNGEDEEEEGDVFVRPWALGGRDVDDDEVESDISDVVESLLDDLDEIANAGLGFLKKKDDEDSSNAGRNFGGVYTVWRLLGKDDEGGEVGVCRSWACDPRFR